MPRSIFILMIFACAAISTGIAFAEENAPNGRTVLHGIIRDTTLEQNPIEGVSVKIVGTDNKVFTVKTNAKGEYKFDSLPAGRYLMSVSKKGYIDRVDRPVTIVDSGDHFAAITMQKMGIIDKSFIERLLKQAIEDIGERYKLEKPSVEALYQSLLEVVLEQRNPASQLLIEGNLVVAMALLSSQPDSKAVFAKHLTETQLHDYIDFIEKRLQRAWQTVAHFLTVFLDKTLSLNPKQREDVLKLLRDTIDHSRELPLASMFSGYNLQREVVDFLHDGLNISLQTILTPTQAKIWQGLINPKNADKKDSDDESQLPQLIAAVLTAHTEQQLGTLSEQEKQRLRIAIKGIIQQAIEAQPDIEEKVDYIGALAGIMGGFMMQELTREQAAEQLEVLKKTMVDKTGMGKRWERLELHNLTNHPLYQRTIKDVLSEEAYRQYTARQTEREVFQTQASQALLVTSLDAMLLLKEAHRKQLETTAAQLTLLSLSADGLHMMATEMLIKMNPEILDLLRQYSEF